MKTMKNFAAQQLTKKQMNEVKGGQQFLCICNSGPLALTTTPATRSVFIAQDAYLAGFLTHISCPNGGKCSSLN